MKLPSAGRVWRLAVLLIGAAVLGSGMSFAQVYWDNDNGNSAWGTATNWSNNTVPTSTTDIIFDDTYVSTDQTINLASITRDLKSATFTSALDYTFNNTSTTRYMRFNGTGTNFTQNGSGAVTINAPVYIGTSLFFDGTGAGLVTINGNISDGGGTDLLQKNGSFTLVLNGASNSQDGTVMNAGTLIFGSNAAAGTQGLTLNGGTIESGTAARTLTNTVTVGGNFTVGGTLDLTLSGAMGLGAGTRTVTVSNTGATTFSGVISNGTLVKDGTGTLTISGSGANTLAGGITVADTTLIFNKTAGVSASGSGPLTIGDGIGATNSAILQLSAANQITDTVAVTVNSDGRFNLNNMSDTVGSIAGTGNITLGSGTLTVGSATNNLNSTFDGVVSGTGGLGKGGSGTLQLNGLNTYSGMTTISAGTIKLGSAGDGINTALGTTAAGTTVSSSGALDLNGFTLSTNEALTINGAGVTAAPDGALTNSSGTAATYDGVVTLGSAAAIGGTGDIDLTSGLVGNFTLTKSGSNTLTLNASSARTGGTTISGGTVKLAHVQGLSTTAGTVTLAGGTLDLATDSSVSAYPVTVSTNSSLLSNKATFGTAGITHTLGALSINGSTLSVASGSNVAAGSAYGITFGGTTLTGNATFDVANNGSGIGTLTLGALTDSGTARTTTKIGEGTLLLDSAVGASWRTGNNFIVNEGVARLGANNALGATALTNLTVNATNAGTTALFDVNGRTQSLLSLTFGGTGGTSTSTNNVSIGTGTLTLGGNVTYSATGSPLGATITSSGAGALSLGTANRTFTIGDSTSAADDLTVSASISGTGGIIKAGTGNMVLSGTNSYTGAVTVSAGTLIARSNTALGSAGSTAGTSVTAGAALALEGNVTVTNGTLTLNNSGVSGSGALRNISGYNTWNNNISLGTSSTIASDAGTLVLGKTDYTSTITGGNAHTLTLDGAGDIYINATVGAGTNMSFTKNGTGTTSFFGNTNNYFGTTTVNEGTLALDTDNTPGNYNTTIRGTLVIGDGTGSADSAVVRHAAAFLSRHKIADTSQVTINADGLLDLNNNDDTVGAMIFTGGHVTTGTGVLTLGGNVTTNASAQSATVEGVLHLGNTTRTFTVADGGAYSDLLINATVDQGNISKAGAGRMTLAGENFYTGTTAVTAGVLNVQHSSGLGGVTGATSVSTGAALELEHATGVAVGAEGLTLNGTGISSGGALRNISGDNSWAGAITLSTASRINSDAGSLTVGGGVSSTNLGLTIGGSGDTVLSGAIGLGSGALTKDGSGTLTMSGTAANSFSGGLNINDGTVVLNRTAGINNASGAGNVTIGNSSGAANTAVLRLNNDNQISNSAVVTINSDGMFDLNGRAETIGNMSGSGTLALSTGSLTVGNATASSTFSGAITGSGTLTKQGTGTLVISANAGSTFTGNMDITAGVLEFSGTFPSTMTDLTLAGGTLRLTGATLNVATLHITGNTVIDFSGASASILNAGTFTIDAGMSLSIIGWTANVDHLTAVTWTGASLNAVGTGPQTQVVFSGFTGADTGWSSSTYPGFNEITPVPEPGTYGAIFIGFATAFAAWRRRKAAKSAVSK